MSTNSFCGRGLLGSSNRVMHEARFNDMAVALCMNLSFHDNNHKNPLIKDCLSAAYRQATV